MSDLGVFAGKLRSKVETLSGSVFDADTGSVSSELDEFSLHGSIIYRLEFVNLLDSDTRLRFSGLFPSWSAVFDLTFSDVSKFTSSNLQIYRSFGMHELRCDLIEEQRHAFITGEFCDQAISFAFKDAYFKKFALETPLSRCDLGWE